MLTLNSNTIQNLFKINEEKIAHQKKTLEHDNSEK